MTYSVSGTPIRKKLRPELLRVHHESIEAWILERAGVKFDAASSTARLRPVA
jgi:hypothetical protein